MKRYLALIVLLLSLISTTSSVGAVEYVRVSGLIQGNSIDAGPFSLAAFYSGTQNQAEIRSDGTYSIVIPKNTPTTFYLRTSKFFFRNNVPKNLTQDKVMDFLIPQPVKFSGKIVDAQGNPLAGGLVSLTTNASFQYKDMSALIEKADSQSIWGIATNTDFRSFADSDGNFTLHSYITQDARELYIFKGEDANGKRYEWRSSPIRGEMPRDFVACVPINFGSNLTLPSYCFEDESAWRDRVSKELVKQKQVEAELKAKQEAAAKAVANKKTTITCIKGKLIKKVTAVKPKCPLGYTVKK